MRLRQLLVLSRDLAKSKEFYAQGLGLPLLRSSETFAEFDTRSGVSLCVKLAQRYGRHKPSQAKPSQAMAIGVSPLF